MTPDQVDRAACRDLPVEMFFPTGVAGRGHPTLADLTVEAKAVCASCEVLDVCRKSFSGEIHGVFFGTNEEDRGVRRNQRPPRRTATRDVVADILAGSPTRLFTATELSEWTGTTPGAVQKALRRLSDSGAVERTEQPDRRPWLYRWAS